MARSGNPPFPESSPVHILVDPDGAVVVAHRGVPAHRPENTLGSFELALDQGADALEMDVHVSADGVPFVVHDPRTGRVGDVDEPVAATSAAALQEIDAGYGFTVDGGQTYPWRGRGVTLPTLAEVLAHFATVPIILELKSPGGQEHVRRTLDRHGARTHVVVASALHEALRVFDDDVYYRSASRREIAMWYFLSFVGVSPPRREYALLSIPERKGVLELVAPGRLSSAARSGIPVTVWTIDDPSVAQGLWRHGVTGIITNVPAIIAPLRPGEQSA